RDAGCALVRGPARAPGRRGHRPRGPGRDRDRAGSDGVDPAPLGPALPVVLTGIVAASLVEMVVTSVLIPLLGLVAYALSPLLSPVGTALPGALWAALLAVLGAVVALALTFV